MDAGAGQGPDFAQRNLRFAVDVLVFSAHLQYRRMQEAALLVGSGEPDDAIALNVFLADAMAFVNVVDQLRRVVPRLPGAGELRIWKDAFVRAARSSEEARHHFAHLDRSIVIAAEHGESAFGHPSWVVPPPEGDESGIVQISFSMPGPLTEGAVSATQVWGGPVDRPVGKIVLRIAGEDYDLSAAHDAVSRLEQRLPPSASETSGE